MDFELVTSAVDRPWRSLVWERMEFAYLTPEFLDSRLKPENITP